MYIVMTRYKMLEVEIGDFDFPCFQYRADVSSLGYC